jgi:CheY-like chemotaxis protein/anti-sigma regulatory factor (Ser/Thr protein kinase)
MSRVLIVEDDRATRLLLRATLKRAGFSVATASDGTLALRQLRKREFDLMLVDIWMPRMTGLELMSRLPEKYPRPKVVVMTSDDTPGTLLQAVREQAYQYINKPIQPKELIAVLHKAMAAKPASLPIQLVSARPHWVELLVPCDRDAAERIQSFMARLKADLSDEVRESVGWVFRELLLNAIEWGGKLDPRRKVRISYIRARRMLIYRISDPGKGFRFEDLNHAAIANPSAEPSVHMDVREEKGMRPGGFGILMARAMVDELLYNEAQNEVVFVKYLTEDPPAKGT